MTDTQMRIQAYKDALPGLKERVAAVALLLVMSFAMMTSASFAWLTISRRPEVTGVNTTVAANGNLEIALADTDGKAPDASAVGDSSATKGNSIASANITWGNLVNLSDPSYGLENLVLRPAQLNTAALLTSPLYGAMYGGDGRITKLNSEFGYATWNMPEGDKPGYFGVSSNYGVRAISSTKTEAVGAEAIYLNLVKVAKEQNMGAATMYTALGSNDKYMPSLATMMGLYMTARMNSDDAKLSNPDCDIADIQNLRDMYKAFLECFDAEAQAMADMINIGLFLKEGEGYTPFTIDDIYSNTTASIKAMGFQITKLDEFIKDRKTVASDYQKMVDLCSSGTSLKWKDSGLNEIVNNLVNVGACTIGADNTPISSIGASNALNYLSGTQEAKITNGILLRFEERTGGYIEVKGLGISATVKRMGLTIPATVKANIQTTASRDSNHFTNDLVYTESLNTGNYQGGISVAEDTYGLAVDLWVRTNAAGSYLTLEGNVLTESHEVPATGTDPNGNSVQIYTLAVSGQDEEGNTVSDTIDCYQIEGKSGWYDAFTHEAIADELLSGASPKPKMDTITTVIGYEGENRVWGDNDSLSVDSTTQGSGSCYVYYADSPEDQARSLKLLESFNVAFVDQKGKLIGKAIMDTERFYASSGRVIVPLVLDPSSTINLGEDIDGNVSYGLMPLETNVPTRITAIVYLDGTKLTNQEVLAASDIQGQLNIQFGSSQDLNPITNEALEMAERRVSASVDKTAFDYDTVEGPMTTNVTVRVDGDEPNTVTAFFLRSVSATQGSREATMTFEPNENGEWVASHTFVVPGTYVLRSVRLDGVDYDLSSPPTVVVNGFTVASLSCDQATDNYVNILSPANSGSVDLRLRFATDDITKMPSTVSGRYLRTEDGSAVNVDFTYDSTTHIWSGSANFRTSGEYKLQYLILDGEYAELDESMWQTAKVTLGMRVAVYTTSPHEFTYKPSDMTANQKLLAMQVKIMDNTGKQMPGLDGVKLTYNMKGSGVKKMDADLTWNGKYYVGELITYTDETITDGTSVGGAGIWQFGNVVVGQNVLTTATEAPTFTIKSPEPPVYYDHSTVASQYKPNNDAQMNVQITNSAAATVQAYITKSGESEGHWIDGVIGGQLTTSSGATANHWYFTLPTDSNGYQDGNWTLTELRLWDVFAADGTAYTEESPLIFDVSDTDNKTKVSCRIFISINEDKSADFGKDSSGNVTGAFMTGYDVSGLVVTIRDFAGEPIPGVSDVKLTFEYTNGSSGTYGGYTSAALNNVLADVVIDFPVDANDGTKYVQNGAATFRYAGSYTTKFSYKIGGQTYTLTDRDLPTNSPKFTVSSVAPTVKITSAYFTSASSDSAASFTDTSTTVYIRKTTGTCNVTNYKPANVTITLAGYGNASSAKLQFTTSNGDGKVHLYEESQKNNGTATDAYQWDKDGGCLRHVGYWKSQTGGDSKTAAGTLTATTLKISYNNIDYVVDIADITIKNPS